MRDRKGKKKYADCEGCDKLIVLVDGSWAHPLSGGASVTYCSTGLADSSVAWPKKGTVRDRP